MLFFAVCKLNCPTGAITVDSGVGCAAAMILAAVTGKKEGKGDYYRIDRL